MKPSLIVLTAFLALGFSTGASPTQREIKDENLDSLSHSFQQITGALTTPEFERRKKVLRLFQQRGYVQVLSDVMADDGVSALLSLLKVNAQIAYHLPHNDIVFHIPVTEVARPDTGSPWHFLTPRSSSYDIPLVQDWNFPADPWGDR